jgi:hypothetical protein
MAAAEDDVRAIAAPPLGAAAERATVQDDVAAGAIETESHENPFNASGWKILTVPAAPEVDNEVAEASAPSTSANWSKEEMSFVEFEMVNETVASTPSVRTVESTLHNTHLRTPGELLHVIDLFAAIGTGPAAMLDAEKSVGE